MTVDSCGITPDTDGIAVNNYGMSPDNSGITVDSHGMKPATAEWKLTLTEWIWQSEGKKMAIKQSWLANRIFQLTVVEVILY